MRARQFRVDVKRRENSRKRNLANLSGRFERVVRAEEAGTAAA